MKKVLLATTVALALTFGVTGAATAQDNTQAQGTSQESESNDDSGKLGLIGLVGLLGLAGLMKRDRHETDRSRTTAGQR